MTEDFRTTLFDITNKVAGVQKNAAGVPLTVEQLFSAPIDSYDIDSITFLEVIMAIEDKFDVTMGETDPESYETFADVEADLLRQIKVV